MIEVLHGSGSLLRVHGLDDDSPEVRIEVLCVVCKAVVARQILVNGLAVSAIRAAAEQAADAFDNHACYPGGPN